MEEINLKTAVISGGNGFLGRAIRTSLESSGWRVITLGRHIGESDKEYRCDISSENDVRATIAKVVDRYGIIDACIHAAVHTIENKPLTDISAEAFDTQMEVTVGGAFLLSAAAIPHMSKGAAFIGITTKLLEAGMTLMPMGAYVPAKAALRGFLRVLANDTRSRGIRVYAVAPGFLPGGLNSHLPDAVLRLFASKTGAGTASLEETVDLIKTLCTEPSAYVPGSSVAISPIACSAL